MSEYFSGLCVSLFSLLDGLLEFLTSLGGLFSWPIVVLISLFCFKSELSAFINRLRAEIGQDGRPKFRSNDPDLPARATPAELGTGLNPNHGVVIGTTGTTGQTDTVPAVNFYQDLIIKALIEKHLPQVRERVARILDDHAQLEARDYLETLYLETFAALEFEKTYQAIFGSQISFLRLLRDKSTPVTREEARPFYLAAKKEFPDFYIDRDFDRWLNFLLGQQLVSETPEGLVISIEGKAFLNYIIQARNYFLGRAG